MKRLAAAARIAVIAGVLVLGSSTRATAVPIPVGSDLMIFFDFSVLPSPCCNWTYASTSLYFSGQDPGETIIVDLFGKNGGLYLTSTKVVPGPGTYQFRTDFSNYVGVRVLAGSVELIDSIAGGTGGEFGSAVHGTLVPVPEPASLMLLGVGLAGVVGLLARGAGAKRSE